MALILFFVLTTLILAARGHSYFRPDYRFDDQTTMYYKLHSTPTSLPNAIGICENEDASLFYPRTQEHLRAVNSFVQHENNQIRAIIIGIHDKFTEGLFSTINGENAGQDLKWAANEPNNAGGVEDCVAVIVNNNLMNDIHCRSKLPFVCERNQTDIAKFNTFCNTFDKGYRLNRDQRKCYKMSLMPENWFDAFRSCNNEGSQLMIVDSSKKASLWYLLDIPRSPPIRSSNRNYSRDFFHVGFHDLLGEGVFRTLEGKRLEEAGYDRWKEGCPATADTLCGAINLDRQLLDVSCSQKALFVCERDANKEALDAADAVAAAAATAADAAAAAAAAMTESEPEPVTYDY